MLRTFEDWNRCLTLESPTLRELVAITGWSEPQLAWPHSHLLWLIGPNLAAVLDPAHAPPGHVAGPVKKVILILTSSFFASTANVQTADLTSFRMLGRSLPCNAAELRTHLDQLGGPVDVYTEAAQISIVAQGRTEFRFEPSSGGAIRSMEETRLVSVENIYRSWMSERPALITS